MKFIVQHNMMNEDSLKKIKQALEVNNIPHQFVGVIPFSHEITTDEPLVSTDFLPYGSTLMTNLTGPDGLKWRGNYFDPVTFRAERWNAVRDDMLNTDIVCRIDYAVKFLRTQTPKSMWFTRPCEDLKQFSGMVIEAEECADWFEDAMACESSGSYQLSPDTMVVISTPRNIQAEWRWFVVDGKVISGSLYRLKGEMHQKNEIDSWVISEAQRFADVWLPHRNCCMDLALVDNEVKVIEFNTINSSGLYDHDANAIIKALWEDFIKD